MKLWPKRMFVAGIILTIIGAILTITGIVLLILGSSELANLDNPTVGKFFAGYCTLIIGISAFLIEGIAFWIVGAIFKNKYATPSKK